MKIYAAMLIVAAGALGGCGYKPLVAPCGMDEGGGPRVPVGREQATPAASEEGPIQTLYYAEPTRPIAPAPFSAIARGDDCGPLRPINSGVLR